MTDSLVLFLDFDGVLHPQICAQDELFCQLPVLEAVLLDYPRVAVVISSSWREFHPLTELRVHFSSAIRPRVIDVTPSIQKPNAHWLPGQRPEWPREWECMAWLGQMRPRGTRWLAIDDRDDWFRPDCSDLFLTNPEHGFTDADAPRLRRMLEERL